MEKKTYYKFLFLFNAVWGIILSLPVIFLHERVLPNFGIAVPDDLLWMQLFLWFVFLFALGYFIVSRDIQKNHGIVIIGILSKVVVFTYFLWYLLLGDITIQFFALAVVDLIGACLMMEFLINVKKLE